MKRWRGILAGAAEFRSSPSAGGANHAVAKLWSQTQIAWIRGFHPGVVATPALADDESSAPPFTAKNH
jgi:hypothetical protein